MRAPIPVFSAAGLVWIFVLAGCSPAPVVEEPPAPEIEIRKALPVSTPTPTPAPRPAINPRERVIAVAASQIGTTEATGHNDGEVVKYLNSVGLGKGQPYCAAFVYWCGREALGKENPYPRSAWSPDQVQGGTLIKSNPLILPGDTWGIYFPKKGRVAHTGFFEKDGKTSVTTIEANTSPQAATGEADRNGDGVWRKKRLKASLYNAKSWLN